jgi:hypothetical protein
VGQSVVKKSPEVYVLVLFLGIDVDGFEGFAG